MTVKVGDRAHLEPHCQKVRGEDPNMIVATAPPSPSHVHTNDAVAVSAVFRLLLGFSA